MIYRLFLGCTGAAFVLATQFAAADNHQLCAVEEDRIVCAEAPSSADATEQAASQGSAAEIPLIGQSVFFGLGQEELIGNISGLIKDDRGELVAVSVRVAGAENEVTFPIGQIELRQDPADRQVRLYFAPRAAMVNGPSTGAVRTSRSFVGPQQFPPEEFAAYGIVAFPARAVTGTGRQRHLDACKAYVATLPTPSELSVPPEEQMVTVWPVNDAQLGAELTERTDAEVCETAVERYHLETALTARNHARMAGGGALRGRGPFLLAWSPSSHKGREDALVLVADLSSATSFEHFEGYFRQWREDIEQSPELWENGWSLSLVRTRIRDWADRWGATILSLRGG